MRKLILMASALVIVGALAVGVAASSAATKKAKVVCSDTEYNASPNSLTGVGVGVGKCSKPLGENTLFATYTATFDASTGAGTAKGTFTRWFATGTDHGRYSETFQFTSNSDATYNEKVIISGGTGAFAGAKGTASKTCRTTNAGATLTCKAAGAPELR